MKKRVRKRKGKILKTVSDFPPQRKINAPKGYGEKEYNVAYGDFQTTKDSRRPKRYRSIKG